MNTQHAKSPCCRGEVIKFGKRRRQCNVCGQTWRIRKKKRGRKRKRESAQLAIKYLDQDIPALYRLAQRQHSSTRRLKLRLRRSLKSFLFNTDWPAVPRRGALVAIADGLLQVVAGKTYTVYLVILKPVRGKKAIILPPRITLGDETFGMWQRVFQSLPFGVWGRIVALVCDGRAALVGVGQFSGWPVQLCHFHLRKRLAAYLRDRPKAKNPELARQISRLIDTVLSSSKFSRVQVALKTLEFLCPTIPSRGVRKVISGFLKNYLGYRTYLEHPELNLPTTSNSVESLVERIRSLQYRARGFSTLTSLTLWVYAILKHKQTMNCNGHLPTKFRS